MNLSPGTRLGSYEITGMLGAGGMGEVYRGRDTKLDRDVAIKITTALGADKAHYAVARDGRFLLNQTMEEFAAPITLIQNWAPLVKK